MRPGGSDVVCCSAESARTLHPKGCLLAPKGTNVCVCGLAHTTVCTRLQATANEQIAGELTCPNAPVTLFRHAQQHRARSQCLSLVHLCSASGCVVQRSLSHSLDASQSRMSRKATWWSQVRLTPTHHLQTRCDGTAALGLHWRSPGGAVSGRPCCFIQQQLGSDEDGGLFTRSFSCLWQANVQGMSGHMSGTDTSLCSTHVVDVGSD